MNKKNSKERKTSWLGVRMTKGQKAKIEKNAKTAGFQSASTYLLWFYERHTNGSMNCFPTDRRIAG